MSTKGKQDLSSMPFRALEPTRSPTPHTHYGRHHQRIDRAFNSGTLGNPGSSFAYHYDKHGWKYGSRSNYLRSAERAQRRLKSSPGNHFRGSPGGKRHHGRWSTFW